MPSLSNKKYWIRNLPNVLAIKADTAAMRPGNPHGSGISP